MKLVVNRSFKQKILQLLVELYKKAKVPDYTNMCRCLVFLDEPSAISALFLSLLKEESEVVYFLFLANAIQDKTLLVFQIAFELVDNATQQFRSRVKDDLPQANEGDGI